MELTVNDNSNAALLGLLDAFLDTVNEVGAASTDITAKHVRAVALVVDTQGEFLGGI